MQINQPVIYPYVRRIIENLNFTKKNKLTLYCKFNIHILIFIHTSLIIKVKKWKHLNVFCFQ